MDYSLVLTGSGPGHGILFIADNNRFRETSRGSVRLLNATTGRAPITVREIGGRTWFDDATSASLGDYRRTILPVADLLITDASGLLASLATPQLAVGERGTLLLTGTAGGDVTAVLLVDAQPYAQITLANELGSSVDLLVNGQSDQRLSGLSAGSVSGYQALLPGTYTFQIVPAGSVGPALATLTAELEPGADYTLLGYANQQSALLNDRNTLPTTLGTVRVRLINAVSDGTALDLAVATGGTLASGVEPGSASDYIVLPAGSAHLLVQGTSGVLDLPGLVLNDGDTISLYVTGFGAALQNTLVSDVMVDRQTTSVYSVPAAQPGTWQQRLSNIPTDGNGLTFMGATFAAPNPPALSAAQALATGPQTATASWRLIATGAVGINVYATTDVPGLQTGTGTLVRENVLLPADGTLQSAEIDLSMLPSGTYYLYLATSNGDDPTIKAYAPQPLVVTTPWSATWVGQLQATPRYRALDVRWLPNTNPDVDGYVLRLDEVGVSGPTRVISVGNTLEARIDSLSPNSAYTITLHAIQDAATVSPSSGGTVQATVLAAEFTLSMPTGPIAVRAGDAVSVSLALSTPLAVYPEIVGLTIDALPAGLGVAFASQTVTPTMTGTITVVQLQPSLTLPTGVYTVLVRAQGAGASQQLEIVVTVLGRSFALESMAGTTLAEGASQALSIPTAAINGGEAPIRLSLENVPNGLDYTVVNDLVVPGTTATLLLSDTQLLAHGTYVLTVVGDDGTTRSAQSLNLQVTKSGFSLTVLHDFVTVSQGERADYALQLVGRGGWSTPGTLFVDAALIPEGIAVGFAATNPTGQLSPTLALTTTIGMDQPIWLVATVSMTVTDGLYALPVSASSGGKTTTQWVYVGVNVIGPARVTTIYLPTVLQATAPSTTRVYLPLLNGQIAVERKKDR